MFNFRSNDKDGEGVFWTDSTPQAVRDAYPRKDELNFVRMLNGVLPREIRITACVDFIKFREKFEVAHFLKKFF